MGRFSATILTSLQGERENPQGEYGDDVAVVVGFVVGRDGRQLDAMVASQAVQKAEKEDMKRAKGMKESEFNEALHVLRLSSCPPRLPFNSPPLGSGSGVRG